MTKNSHSRRKHLKSNRKRKSTTFRVHKCNILTSSSSSISQRHKHKIKQLSVKSRRLRNGNERACISVVYRKQN
jgi:transcription elongation factor Elf1